MSTNLNTENPSTAKFHSHSKTKIWCEYTSSYDLKYNFLCDQNRKFGKFSPAAGPLPGVALSGEQSPSPAARRAGVYIDKIFEYEILKKHGRFSKNKIPEPPFPEFL